LQSYEINFNKNNSFYRKMNKDVLVALIAKDVNELQVLTEGLDQMDAIPAPYLRLALDKSKALTANLDNLINYLNNKEIEDRLEAQRKAEIEAKQAEEALREAELARIAEEQEALFRAEELERQRREEERRKAEAEIARQAAAIEAARQAELAEKRRKEEEALRREEEERIRLEAEQAEARRRAEEQARIQAELEEKRRRAEEQARIQAELEEKRRRAEEQARIQAELEEKRRREEETRPQEEQPIVPISSVTSIVDAVADPQVTTVADSIETSESLADKLAKNADDTLASAINNKKIIDLKASITLGDRFRFQRELFGGNGEKMNKAISDFNSFETMTEAQEYIAKNFANWALDSDTVSDFIQLLQRRYL
jgi:DNA repair exonuclease SbcCD ATPase subunit